MISFRKFFFMHRSIINATLGLFLGLMIIFPAAAQQNNNTDDDLMDEASGLEESVMPPSPFKIVGFGDSLMAGYLLGANESFPAKLEQALQQKGYDVTVTNAGVSGDTTSAGKDRLDWSVPDDTNLVILELGANDMLRGISPDITRENLDDMLASLKERKIPVILAGMKAAPNFGEEYGTEFNQIYTDLAQKYNIPLYPFFLEGIAANQHYILSDGMHPNSEGVDIMVKNFLPLMEKELQSFGVHSE